MNQANTVPPTLWEFLKERFPGRVEREADWRTSTGFAQGEERSTVLYEGVGYEPLMHVIGQYWSCRKIKTRRLPIRGFALEKGKKDVGFVEVTRPMADAFLVHVEFY